MQGLPVGVQSFERLREDDLLYVDKTVRLIELIKGGGRYFLSRPRRFGKSLTLSTLEAMFAGRSELFKGLAAEEWVKNQSKHPSSVLRFDMSRLRQYSNAEELNDSIIKGLEDFAFLHDFEVKHEKKCSGTLLQIIYHLYKKCGYVVVLIDEYDKPILDNLEDVKKAEAMREVLRSFYIILKSCDEYLRFVFITGISKFSKAGVFSALNNLQDISMNSRYGDIVGYTQEELELHFADWIGDLSKSIPENREILLKKIKDYYDGFSFDGETKLYNPFSILNFFLNGKFGNYWYVSGSPTFIVKYMKKNIIQDPEEYRHLEVSADFSDVHEIEKASPESFLYQSGYLTIEKWLDSHIILDYPNEEVKSSLTRMYLDEIYHIKKYITLGTQIWNDLADGNIENVVNLYNIALSGIPYDDFPHRDEFWYRSLFLMLLRGA
ncbi:AAA family ATPase, partial [bacterium]|nr:AAA family ATPase [bacterium]